MKFSEILIFVLIVALAFAFIDAALPYLDNYVSSKSLQKTHFVSQGETLWDISEYLSCNSDIRLVIVAIKQVNKIDSLLQRNQKLILPID